MSWQVALIIALPAAFSIFAYWRARRLHLRILDIEPGFSGLCRRKAKPHD